MLGFGKSGHICICECIYICVCVYVYVYVYIYIYMYMYMYMYTVVWKYFVVKKFSWVIMKPTKIY